MRTLIKAGIVYPVRGKPIPRGCVAISDGVIEAVGQRSIFDENAFDKVTDLCDCVLLPGFVNAHSHLQLASAKGKTTFNGDFADWIRQVIRFNAEVTPKEREAGVIDGIDEMRQSGITAVADTVSDADFAEPLISSSMRSVIFVEAVAPLQKDAVKTALDVKKQVERLLKQGVMAGISPHAPHTVSPELFRLLKSISDEMKLPLATHIAETEEEYEFIKNGSGKFRELFFERKLLNKNFSGTGKTPVALMADYGALEGILAVHLNVLGSEDMKLILDKSASPVFCPASSRWFGRKNVMPLKSLIRAGARVALGTDSLASNYSLSMLDELRCCAEFFPNIDRAKFIEMATINGAEHLSLNCGSIEKGRWADIIAFKWDGISDPLDCVFKAEKALTL